MTAHVVSIDLAELARLAEECGIPNRVRVLRALMSVESRGDATALRFEPQLFRRLSAHRFDEQIPYRPDERGIDRHRENTDRGAFEHAFKLDAIAAIRASSWGIWQVLGAHLLRVEGDPVKAVALFDADPAGTSKKLLASWWREAPVARRAANADPPDFDALARIWNGPGQVTHYAAALRLAYAKAEA